MTNRTTRTINSIFILFMILFSATQAAQRYKDRVFLSVETQEDILYRTATNSLGSVDSLLFDLYTPSGDTEENRPLVIFIHGGSFISGSRKDDYAASFCTDMALRGYAAASISYRLGLLGMTEAEFRKALYRAMQDSKAAVRFFRANASEYGIDPETIICAGYSAGALTSIHHAYIQNEDASLVSDETLMGPLETGDNLEFSSEVKAVVSYAGAIGDSLWVTNGNTPMISIHGTADVTVPFEAGHAFGMQFAPMLYGSGCIHRELDRRNIMNKLIVKQGETHTLTVDTWSSSYTEAADFLYDLMNHSSPIARRPALKPSLSSAAPRKTVFIRNAEISGPVFNLRGRQIKAVSVETKSAGLYLIEAR